MFIFPPSDGRTIILSRYTPPEADLQLLLEQLSQVEGFGWHVQRLDGNDLRAVKAAFDTARHLADPVPRVILFDTLMGKGIPFLEMRETTRRN